MWAIQSRGVGRPVSHRRVRQGWPLAEGEILVASDPAGKVLASDGRSLEDGALAIAKARRRAWVNEQQDADQAAGCVYAGNTFDMDAESQTLLTARIAALQAGITLPEGFFWTSADDVDVPMDAAGLLGLATAMVRRGEQIHVRQRTAKIAIEAATTVAAVEAVTYGD